MFKERELTLSSDCYSYAFASCIDMQQLRENEDLTKDGYLKPIDLTDDEQARMFLGSLIVSGVQITMIYLIIHEMEGEGF